MSEFDSLQRFLFEDMGIRGELVRLDASWHTVLERHPYPAVVRAQLGQALAAALLLSATIKFRGSLILQAQSTGPLRTLVAQATHTRTVRGLAHWNGEVNNGNLGEIYGQGRLVLTIQNEGSDPYQGIVNLEGEHLADAIGSYFAQSEQLQTRLWLAADGQRAAGLFIQELPSQRRTAEDWERITHLANTLTDPELLHLPSEKLLYRLFHEEQVRMFDPEPVSFHCGCSRERIESALLGLGLTEVEAVLREHAAVKVDCEFCNREYLFDPVDIGLLFSQQPKAPTTTTRQ